jgi:hypothetical protein
MTQRRRQKQSMVRRTIIVAITYRYSIPSQISKFRKFNNWCAENFVELRLSIRNGFAAGEIGLAGRGRMNGILIGKRRFHVIGSSYGRIECTRRARSVRL